jgi:hypothetical protein
MGDPRKRELVAVTGSSIRRLESPETHEAEQ